MTYIAIKSKDDCSEALEAARQYSPNIEIVDETTLVFDLTGSKAKEALRIAAKLREKFASVAVSENLAAALLLATWSQAREFQVSSSKFQVENSGVSTARGSERQSEPPAVAGGDADEFKVQSSRFQVCETDAPRAQAPDASRVPSAPVVTAREDKEPSFNQQTLNSEPETLNAPQAQAPDASRVPRAPVVTAREDKEPSFNQQTLNSEPGTLNAPQAPTLNFEPETLNAPQAQTLNALSTQHSALSTVSALPIDAISRKAEFLELMDSWAIHNLGSFARLPEDEMVARFGLEIIGLLKQARGEAFRAPNWNVKDDKFFWAKDLEGAIETIEPLNFVLSKGVEQIFQNLDYAGLSTQDAKITLKGRAREKIYRIRLVFPTKNQKVWIRQIVTKIELDPPGFNIEGVGIEFRSTKPRAVQNNLYSGTVMEPENLDLIVSKLKKVVGLEKIGLPKLRDSWSEAFYMTENLSTLIEEKDRFKVRKEKFKVQSSKFKVENSGVRSQESDLSGQWSVVGGQKEQLKVQSSKFKVGNSGVSTARGSGRQSEPPAVAGGGSDEFQVPDSGVGTQYSVPSTQSETVISHQFRASFYYLPKPITARVFFESGEPKALLIKGKREMVRTAGGPWRMDAEWYKAKDWRRDEWDIETESGAVYRVFTDKNGEAFVDGGYD